MKARGFTLIEFMIVLVILMIVGCLIDMTINRNNPKAISNRSQGIASTLVYFEDENTHLCFVRQYDKVVATVDCDVARKQIKEYDRQNLPHVD